MKIKSIGILFVVIGIVMMIYTGFTYVTTERVVDIGSIKINKEKNHPVQWSPIIGGIMLACGIILIATSKNEK